jgi:hypothetical protein
LELLKKPLDQMFRSSKHDALRVLAVISVSEAKRYILVVTESEDFLST